ncbi:MAG TPA: type I-U CRISPR-associated RAMP protein Csb1/Cas7u [Bryobacteraceae bacterium]|jgi:CRISPR-associated protein Csb1|nr:type I-U CRISPR-associated RAMP protein Csb1/Cas7u [Bryobacteraceae bacterium]
MSESPFTQFTNLLKPDGPVAIVIKQVLAPANEDDPIIFPPTYPLTTFKGRIHTLADGEYRVSVELPPYPKSEKNEKASEQSAGYNIDRFPDGTNSCEIDSPQSQANRIEPEFKKPKYRDLVPQVEIKVGDDQSNGTIVNLLDAGHRAGDAVVRLSSLAKEFHDAFLAVKAGNHFKLATLAPTSLLFGVWDSRSTQVKVQRVLKASIRASNVRECTRSAQFTPAADYVAAGAVEAGLDEGKSDQNPLSSEGMKHALAVQKAGGVMLTPASQLTRTVNLNLTAVRALAGCDEPHTEVLQRYILGLGLLAATIDQDLNLREGCNLRFRDKTDKSESVPRRGEAVQWAAEDKAIEAFARASTEEFFELAGIAFDRKDHLDAVFESGVAEEFLAMKQEDRDWVRAQGPITAATLKRFRDQGDDRLKPAAEALAKAKKALPKWKKGQPPVHDQMTLKPVHDAIKLLSEDPTIPENVKAVASELTNYLAADQPDSYVALKHVETELKALKKLQKVTADADSATAVTTPSE